MSTNPSATPEPSGQPPVQPATLSPREQRRAARQQRRAERYGGRGGVWLGGVILVLLGVILLLQNLGGLVAGNWWALFILLPAVESLGAAWNIFDRSGGQLTGAAIGSLITGLVLAGLAFALFFNLDIARTWPIAVILIGIGVLVGAFHNPTSQ